MTGNSCRRAIVCAAVLLLAAVPAVAAAKDAPTLVATGTAQTTPKPADRKSEKSIHDAVEAAEAKALPLAVRDARDHAVRLARAARLKLGSLVSISDSQQPGYPVFFGAQYATFPGGHFCGQQRNLKSVPGPNGFTRRVPGKGTHRVCRVPRSISASVTLTYSFGT